MVHITHSYEGKFDKGRENGLTGEASIHEQINYYLGTLKVALRKKMEWER